MSLSEINMPEQGKTWHYQVVIVHKWANAWTTKHGHNRAFARSYERLTT